MCDQLRDTMLSQCFVNMEHKPLFKHKLQLLHSTISLLVQMLRAQLICDIWPLIGIKRMASHSIV